MSENDRTKILPPEKMRALGALLISGDNKHAAEAAGVNERTIRRWRDEDPDFQEALQLATTTALASFNMVLASSAAPVARRLRSFALSDVATPAQQLRALIALADLNMRQQELSIRQADQAMRQKEHDEFAQRIAALEEGAHATS